MMQRNALFLMFLGLAGCSGRASTSSAPPNDAGVKEASAKRDAGHHPEDAGMKETGARDAAPVHDGNPPDGGPVKPFDAAAAAWTWVDVPGATCADGTATGFAINPSITPSDGVLIFMEGGGACWDGTSCWGPASTAFYVQTGYTQLTFETDPQVSAIYLLDRTAPNNPFAGKNLVYIPYCTGDVFSGNRVASLSYLGVPHDTHFVGYENVTLFIDQVNTTFPGTQRVWLAGDSAGGFGAAVNFQHVQEAMPGARVDVLDDSGQPVAPAPGRWAMWTSAWNAQLPAACSGCSTDVGAFVDYYRMKYPGHRFGLISYEYDVVISPFMAITEAQFQSELYTLAGQIDASWPDARYFVLPGMSHVGLLSAATNPALTSWISAMVTDDPTWGSSKP